MTQEQTEKLVEVGLFDEWAKLQQAKNESDEMLAKTKKLIIIQLHAVKMLLRPLSRGGMVYTHYQRQLLIEAISLSISDMLLEHIEQTSSDLPF